MTARRALPWLLGLSLGACADGRGILEVRVSAYNQVVGVDHLRVFFTQSSTGKRSNSIDLSLRGRPVPIDPTDEQTFAAGFPPELRGSIDIQVEAFSTSGLVARGYGNATEVPSRVTMTRVYLPAWSGGAMIEAAMGARLRAVWGSDANNVYVVGDGHILHSTDSGGSWAELAGSPGPTGSFVGVWGSGSDNVYVLDGEGGLWHTGDGGQSWDRRKPGGGGGKVLALWGSAPADVYLVGEGGTLLHGDGMSWTVAASDTKATLRSVWGSSAGDVYAVGDGGTTLHYSDAMSGWKKTELEVSVGLVGVGGSVGDVYAVGSIGSLTADRIFHTADGQSWKSLQGSDWDVPTAVWGVGSSDAYVMSRAGRIFYTADGGTTRVEQAGLNSVPLNAVWGSGPGDVYAVGEMGTLLHLY